MTIPLFIMARRWSMSSSFGARFSEGKHWSMSIHQEYVSNTFIITEMFIFVYGWYRNTELNQVILRFLMEVYLLTITIYINFLTEEKYRHWCLQLEVEGIRLDLNWLYSATFIYVIFIKMTLVYTFDQRTFFKMSTYKLINIL